MKLILAMLLALASCCAFAQVSTPLLENDTRPVVGETAKVMESLKALPRVKAVFPIKMNTSLLNSKALDITIDGNVAHFVGKMTESKDSYIWNGTAYPAFASIRIAKEGTGVGGSITMNGRMFTVFGHQENMFLMEIEPEGVGKPASGVAPPRPGVSAPFPGKGG